MKMISLREFKERFYPQLTGQQFSKMLGVNNSMMNKMLNGKYDCSLKSKSWLALCEYVKNNYNLQLVSENKFVLEGEKVSKVIRNLQLEIKQKDQIIAEYEKTIEELTSAVRIMVGAKSAVEKGKFILNLYKKNKEDK